MVTCRGRPEITRPSRLIVDESLASSAINPKPGHSEIRGYWKTWLVISTFCVIWFAGTMLAIVVLFIGLDLFVFGDVDGSLVERFALK